MTTFSERLNMLMEEKSVSISALADEINVSYQAIRKAAQGGAMGKPNSDKVAKFFKVNRDWMFDGSGKRDDPYGATQQVDLVDDEKHPDEIRMLAKTFALIPEGDQKSRTLAYNAASAAIMQFVDKD